MRKILTGGNRGNRDFWFRFSVISVSSCSKSARSYLVSNSRCQFIKSPEYFSQLRAKSECVRRFAIHGNGYSSMTLPSRSVRQIRCNFQSLCLEARITK